MTAKRTQVNISFELVGDQFPHAWVFNRFRVNRMGGNVIVAVGLAVDRDSTLPVNAIVLNDADIKNNKDRAMDYLARTSGVRPPKEDPLLSGSSVPVRVYPVNYFHLSRVEGTSELGFYRFSLNSLADRLRLAREGGDAGPPIKCHPVVMFRSDADVQIALLKELYSA